MSRWAWIAAVATMLAAPAIAPGAEPARTATKNVVIVTTDGLRPEEVFAGAEPTLFNKEVGGVADVEALRRDFCGDDPARRRSALLPFLWGVVAKEGQLYGNADRGSSARVTNGRNFSYPGYNELLTGAADPRIDSNDKKPNANVSVLEWLNRKPEYRGRVAAFASWDCFPFILNAERGGLPVNAGWMLIAGDAHGLSERQAFLNRLMAEVTHTWAESRDDPYTFHAALEHVRQNKPRVLYLSFGDTDEHSHAGRYDLYLRAAHRVDAYLKELWDTLQGMPEYRDATTLIVSTDHGRGGLPIGWKSHGAKVPGSEKIWIGVLGPDTTALGERSGIDEVTQSQIAATAAALLGEDYRADAPKAAPPIAEAIRPSRP